jgi:hypothetical protein
MLRICGVVAADLTKALSRMSEEQISLADLARHCEFEKQVAAQAYLFYLEEGCPSGKEREHWFRAEEAVRQRNAGGGCDAGDARAGIA